MGIRAGRDKKGRKKQEVTVRDRKRQEETVEADMRVCYDRPAITYAGAQ